MYCTLLIITAFKSIMYFKHRHRELVFKALVREMLSCCLMLWFVVLRIQLKRQPITVSVMSETEILTY